MEQPRQTEFTADEFIAWAMEQPSGRYELDNGQVVAMAPERVRHNQVKLNAVVALRNAVGARGLACQAVFTDGMAVRVDDRTVYEPDAMLRCGPQLPGDAVKVLDPLVVVEVALAVDPGDRQREEAGRLLRVAERAALPDRRHRAAGGHPPSARRGRRDRRPHPPRRHRWRSTRRASRSRSATSLKESEPAPWHRHPERAACASRSSPPAPRSRSLSPGPRPRRRTSPTSGPSSTC